MTKIGLCVVLTIATQPGEGEEAIVATGRQNDAYYLKGAMDAIEENQIARLSSLHFTNIPAIHYSIIPVILADWLPC